MKLMGLCVGLTCGIVVATGVALWRIDIDNKPAAAFAGGVAGLGVAALGIYLGKSLIPKRSWFRFSLRTLFIATTLFAAVLGRVIYLYRKAEFHDEKFGRLISVISEREHKSGYDDTEADVRNKVDSLLRGDQKLRVEPTNGYSVPMFVFETGFLHVEIVRAHSVDDVRQAIYHRKLANAYGRAVYRPWTIVQEPSPSEYGP